MEMARLCPWMSTADQRLGGFRFSGLQPDVGAFASGFCFCCEGCCCLPCRWVTGNPNVEELTGLPYRAADAQNLGVRVASMSAATRLLKKLDKVLSSYDSFGDDPTALVDEVVAKAAKPLDKLLSKSKPELMAEIYVERDRALIKQEILNRVMAG